MNRDILEYLQEEIRVDRKNARETLDYASALLENGSFKWFIEQLDELKVNQEQDALYKQELTMEQRLLATGAAIGLKLAMTYLDYATDFARAQLPEEED